jgi:hypothetical protein
MFATEPAGVPLGVIRSLSGRRYGGSDRSLGGGYGSGDRSLEWKGSRWRRPLAGWRIRRPLAGWRRYDRHWVEDTVAATIAGWRIRRPLAGWRTTATARWRIRRPLAGVESHGDRSLGGGATVVATLAGWRIRWWRSLAG